MGLNLHYYFTDKPLISCTNSEYSLFQPVSSTEMTTLLFSEGSKKKEREREKGGSAWSTKDEKKINLRDEISPQLGQII